MHEFEVAMSHSIFFNLLGNVVPYFVQSYFFNESMKINFAFFNVDQNSWTYALILVVVDPSKFHVWKTSPKLEFCCIECASYVDHEDSTMKLFWTTLKITTFMPCVLNAIIESYRFQV